jgi:alcohol dehydrogenase, propanol-preferring
MKAMVLREIGLPLEETELPDPEPGPGQLQLKISACGVCRTDLHVVDGELPNPALPIVPGHEIVGNVTKIGSGVEGFTIGERVGVPWLGRTCGECRYCRSGRENLCDNPGFTGYQINGGYAELTVADAAFCFPIHADYSDSEAAPLLCAGLIGYRSFRMIGERVEKLGIYGFGAAAHILAQVAQHAGLEIFAFTSPGDTNAQEFARSLGSRWAGGSDETAPVELDAAIIFASDGGLVPVALRAVRKGGVVVCGGIHMSDIPSFSYDILWGERLVRSVANLTRQDGAEFLALATKIPVRTAVREFPLKAANEALDALRYGKLSGAAVLIP